MGRSRKKRIKLQVVDPPPLDWRERGEQSGDNGHDPQQRELSSGLSDRATDGSSCSRVEASGPRIVTQ